MQKKFVRVNVPHSMLSFPSATLFAVGEIDRERLCGWVERVRRRRAAVHATYDRVSASWLTVGRFPKRCIGRSSACRRIRQRRSASIRRRFGPSSSVMADQTASAGVRCSAFALAALTLRRSSAASRSRSASLRSRLAAALAADAARLREIARVERLRPFRDQRVDRLAGYPRGGADFDLPETPIGDVAPNGRKAATGNDRSLLRAE